MVEVVAALIWDGNKFMICQRPAHKARGLLWEFVGGKVEQGETKAQALIRECREELAVTVSVGDVFMEVTHTYPDITVHLTLFHASITEGIPQKLEHNDIRWITADEIALYRFCPADDEILRYLKRQYHSCITQAYYNQNAESFVQGTQNADMSEQYGFFLKYLLPGCRILDLGCGSGRDSAYFSSQGFEITAVDGSEELCKRAKANYGVDALCIKFEDISFAEEFDGIWACASLLHIGKNHMPYVLSKVAAALKVGGVLYASFKYGSEERITGGRFYNDYTERDLDALLAPEIGLKLLEYRVTEDVRPECAGQQWLNIIAEKEV